MAPFLWDGCMKICTVCPYFGQWPPLFNLYLESCKHNPSLDVLLVTDIEPPSNVPDNVRFVRIGLAELRERFSRSLGFEVAIPAPYKLCDFKPAYGLLFDDYLAGYDFWGHGDIDLVYSDLSPILDPSFLSRFDVVSCHKNWIWGPFCLYRNTADVNLLFQEAREYEEVFRSRRHCCFDESSFRWDELKLSSVFDVNFPYDNMTVVVKRADREGRIRAYFETHEADWIDKGNHVLYDEGKITYRGKELLFLHWGSYGFRRGFGLLPNWDPCPKQFYVTRHRLCTQSQFESPFFQLMESMLHVWNGVRWLIRLCRRITRRFRSRFT